MRECISFFLCICIWGKKEEESKKKTKMVAQQRASVFIAATSGVLFVCILLVVMGPDLWSWQSMSITGTDVAVRMNAYQED